MCHTRPSGSENSTYSIATGEATPIGCRSIGDADVTRHRPRAVFSHSTVRTPWSLNGRTTDTLASAALRTVRVPVRSSVTVTVAEVSVWLTIELRVADVMSRWKTTSSALVPNTDGAPCAPLPLLSASEYAVPAAETSVLSTASCGVE